MSGTQKSGQSESTGTSQLSSSSIGAIELEGDRTVANDCGAISQS
ncbi:MAG: hypothetical protein ABI180_19650 [Microcoleus sp.]